MRSDAATVQQYIDGLPEDRRRAIKTVRAVIRKNLPKGLSGSDELGITFQERRTRCRTG